MKVFEVFILLSIVYFACAQFFGRHPNQQINWNQHEQEHYCKDGICCMGENAVCSTTSCCEGACCTEGEVCSTPAPSCTFDLHTVAVYALNAIYYDKTEYVNAFGEDPGNDLMIEHFAEFFSFTLTLQDSGS